MARHARSRNALLHRRPRCPARGRAGNPRRAAQAAPSTACLTPCTVLCWVGRRVAMLESELGLALAAGSRAESAHAAELAKVCWVESEGAVLRVVAWEA